MASGTQTQARTATAQTSRNDDLRRLYAEAGLSYLPRLLGAIDRNPCHATYGCLDRQFWHYRTIDFPSEMYQEGVATLALAYAHELPGNRWFGQPRLRELCVAALRFTAQAAHADGSCDDYYPFERALGAAVFSFAACTHAYELLELDDPALLRWFERRAAWLATHSETGRLTNHQAWAAVGLLSAAQLTGNDRWQRAAEQKLELVLEWQSSEGWFDEYGGADPGYQTVTIDALVRCQRLGCQTPLTEPLRKAVGFARHFLHRDDSYGGEYGSRGTYHFYPRGLEVLATHDANAAELAEGFLRGLAAGQVGYFEDDRLFAHRSANLLEAYLAWQPSVAEQPSEPALPEQQYFPAAQLLVHTTPQTQTMVSAARGGIFKHFAAAEPPVTDAGVVVQFADGRVAVSQPQSLTRQVEVAADMLTVAGPLYWTRFETATPVKQLIFRVLLLTAGRWCRSLVRWLLQRRLITGRKAAPVAHTRQLQWITTADHDGTETVQLVVRDTLQLTDRGSQVTCIRCGSDHQTAYVAATGVYQAATLQPWFDFPAAAEELNRTGRVELVRTFSAGLSD